MKKVFSSVIYENPLPQLVSKGSAFPGICLLKNGDILATHQMGQAFESIDGTTYISLSHDGGRTWDDPYRAFDKSKEVVTLTDNCKPCVLPDGRIIVLGYQFYRENPNLPIGNPQTGGLLKDEIFYSISEDNGKTWSERCSVSCAWKNCVEASAPITVLADGSLATPITGFKNWEGKDVARNCGRILRSYDGGKTWNDDVVCTEFPNDEVTCFEQRMCQTADGTIAVISWNENMKTSERMNNHITLSSDNGHTFSKPIDTGIRGQASSILSLGGNEVLTIHAVRRDTDKPGIYFCFAEIKDGLFIPQKTECVWQPDMPVVQSKNMAEIFGFLKFGQPSAIKLDNGNILMTHWVCEDGIYKTVINCYEL